MQAIVCVSRSWGIGRDGQLLFRISADLKRFRALTSGKTVLYGRKTLLTFPGARPLPNRRNVVLSRDLPAGGGLLVARSIPEALALAGEDAVVIGGASVYRALLCQCDRVFVTQVDADPPADTFFPDLDADPRFRAACEGPWLEEGGLRFRYVDYVSVR